MLAEARRQHRPGAMYLGEVSIPMFQSEYTLTSQQEAEKTGRYLKGTIEQNQAKQITNK